MDGDSASDDPGGTWRDGRRDTLVLGLLFGTLYFVQGVAEPTEGLITQPVRSLLKSWGRSAGDIAWFSAVISLPWALKPLYGLLTDFVPWAGSRRRAYLIAATGATTAGLLALYWWPPAPSTYQGLVLLLVVPTFGVAFSDVVADGLMIDKGQPRGITGVLQSVQWGASYAATVTAALIGGYLSQHGRQDLGFLVCAAVTGVAFVLAVFVVREDRPARSETVRGAAKALLGAFRRPMVLAACAFVFLWSFNPFGASVLYLFATQELGLSEQLYGTTTAVLAVGAVMASVAYGFFARRLPFDRLLHGSVIAGIACTAAYWWMSGARSALVVSWWVGFTYMIAILIQLDLAARVCPPRVAATLFASIMALSNLALSSAEAVGGALYDRWLPSLGARGAFDALVGVGCAFTAASWLLVPHLRRGGWEATPAAPDGP